MLTSVRILVCLLVAFAGCTHAPRRPLKPLPPDYPPAPKPPPANTPLSQKAATPLRTPPPASAPLEEATWVSLTRWAKDRGLSAPYCLALAPVATYGFTTPRGVLILQVGSRMAWWDGMEFLLGFAPQLIDGHVWVRSLELRKNIEPLAHGWPRAWVAGRSIVLDPGHGGSNTGAHGSFNGAWEKDYTLDVAVRLGQRLAGAGWRVFLTRTNDTDVALADRVAIARRSRADLFLSLHFNSSGGGDGQNGVETYCLTPTGMPSNLTRGYEDDPEAVFPNNAFDTQNVQLAAHLHRAVLRATGQADRGVRRARFMTVLQGQRCPAVLIEGGYLSNPKEAERIADWKFRQQFADAIADALK